jgi:hypothetical protein
MPPENGDRQTHAGSAEGIVLKPKMEAGHNENQLSKLPSGT